MLDSSREGCDDESSKEEIDPVTLCIAAECEYKEQPAIALCTDRRSQTGSLNELNLMIGTEGAYKMRVFRKATVLLAGTHSKALELVTACKPAIQNFTDSEYSHEDIDIVVDQFMKNLRCVAAAQKRAMIARFVENSVGVTHEDFLKLSTTEYSDVWHSIRALNLGADILIAHVSHEPVIIRLDRWGEPHWESAYGVIGNGAEIARAMLCLQPWEPAYQSTDSCKPLYVRVPLEECIFRLHEAHFAAHQANPSSVGETTSYQVLTGRFSASPRDEFLNRVTELVYRKHRIPAQELAEENSGILQLFHSFVTGQFQIEEPRQD